MTRALFLITLAFTLTSSDASAYELRDDQARISAAAAPKVNDVVQKGVVHVNLNLDGLELNGVDSDKLFIIIEQAFDNAADTWYGVDNADAPFLDLVSTTGATSVAREPNSVMKRNTLIFRDGDDCEEPEDVFTVTRWVKGGHIDQIDFLFNTECDWVIEDPKEGEVDFESAFLAAQGKAMGLEEHRNQEAVMNWKFIGQEVRGLERDDEEGIQALYPTGVWDSPFGCSTTGSGPSSGFLAFLPLLALLRRRR